MKEKHKLVLFLSLVFFHLVLISFQVPRGHKPTFFERAVFAVFAPIQHGIVSFFQKTGQIWNRYFYLRHVEAQNQRMREELFFLRQENLLLQHALDGYRSAEEIRLSLSHLSRSIIIASVVGLDSNLIYKSVVLNKGSRDGVKRDMVVLDRQGWLIGRVVDPITLRQSRVQLITDEECGVGVLTKRHRVVGILQGDGRGKCRLKYILKTNRDVEEGEEVLTSGYDGIYPSGLPIGRIVSILEDASVFKKIEVEPYFDFAGFDRVAVLAAGFDRPE